VSVVARTEGTEGTDPHGATGKRRSGVQNAPFLRCSRTFLLLSNGKPYSSRMEVRMTLEAAKKLNDMAAASGLGPSQIPDDARSLVIASAAPWT
jgi:hypothetical protein